MLRPIRPQADQADRLTADGLSVRRIHWPDRSTRSLSATERATPKSKASMCSATAAWLAVGVIVTTTLWLGRRRNVDPIEADAGLRDDAQFRQRGQNFRRQMLAPGEHVR